MKDSIRLSADLGAALQEARLAANLSVTDVAKGAGRVRDVVYRLEKGEEATVTSLFAVLSVLKLQIRLAPIGLPTLAEVQARFGQEDDDA